MAYTVIRCILTHSWGHVINGYISRNCVTELTIDVHSAHVNVKATTSVHSPLNLIILYDKLGEGELGRGLFKQRTNIVAYTQTGARVASVNNP